MKAKLELKNFRIFRIEKSGEIYDQLKSENTIIKVRNLENENESLFLGNEDYIKTIFESDSDEGEFTKATYFLRKIASSFKTEVDLLLGLLKCANDEDEDGLYEYLNKNGGELQWFNLMDSPIDEETISNFRSMIGVLVSAGEIEVESYDDKGFSLDGTFIKYSDSLGYYDENSEIAVIHRPN
jgi:hypothetical protein